MAEEEHDGGETWSSMYLLRNLDKLLFFIGNFVKH